MTSADQRIERKHYLFTGTTQGHKYSLIIKPGSTHSGYECELTTAYPDSTISGQWLRTYPAGMTGQEIRRNMLHYVEV